MAKEISKNTMGKKVENQKDTSDRWMPYKDYIFEQKFFELKLKYFPLPVPEELIVELEKEYVNS